MKIVTPKKHGDARGFFSEVYKASDWKNAGLDYTFVQDNHSLSAAIGVMRGLHFQTAPFAQDKLVRVCAEEFSTSPSIFAVHRRRSESMSRWSYPPRIGGNCSFRSASRMASSPWSRIRKFSTRSRRSIPRRTIADLAFDDPDLGIDWPMPDL